MVSFPYFIISLLKYLSIEEHVTVIEEHVTIEMKRKITNRISKEITESSWGNQWGGGELQSAAFINIQ